MKIDAHQHFWIYNKEDYTWIDDRMNILKRNFLPEDLHPVLGKNGFSGTIAVQARQTTRETRWLLQLAEKYDFIKGVVGWADLRSEKLRSQLDEFCLSEKFAGVRHVVHDEPDDGFMLRDDFLEGIRILKEYNLTYDLLLFPKHLHVAEAVVSMFPDQKFVVDHIAKPLIKDHVTAPWKEDMFELARHPNVWCKLSGIVTEADWQNHCQEDFIPYLDIAYQAFGPGRLMAGSDWPVCLIADEYDRVIGIVENYISRLPEGSGERIMGMNCSEFYGIRNYT
jgi:L-fuconolactonase